MKYDVSQLSHGVKNIHRNKLYQQQMRWRESFLQLLLLKVSESFILRQSKNILLYFGVNQSPLHF